jgi:hypothetical protein
VISKRHSAVVFSTGDVKKENKEVHAHTRFLFLASLRVHLNGNRAATNTKSILIRVLFFHSPRGLT